MREVGKLVSAICRGEEEEMRSKVCVETDLNFCGKCKQRFG